MRQDVTVVFGAHESVEILVPVSAQALSPEAGRRWLDEVFVANQCEPRRASGKLLTADKLLAIADTVGSQRFESDADFRQAYAQAAVAAMGKPVIRVDLLADAVTPGRSPTA